jgi:predicted nucleotidyltransferase
MVTSNFMHTRIADVENVADAIRVQYQHWLSSTLVKLYPRLEGVLLFGSRVNGDATEESDFDVFVVAERYHPGLHDWWLNDGHRIDIHVVSLKSLVRSISIERAERTCFHIKAFSEGVFMCGNEEAQNVQRLARSIYTSPGDFSGWGKIKLNLMSKLRRTRFVSGPIRSIYYAELVEAILGAISLRQFGWLCRFDVMVEWLSAAIPDQLKYLLHCYSMALNGEPQGLLKICDDVANDVCPWVHRHGSYSVTPDGAVSVL